jgi:hypothetical protein
LEVERLVRQNPADGWDFFKVLGGTTPDDYQAVVRTAREVGAAFGGHVPGKVGLSAVLEARQPIIDHLDGYLFALDAYRERLRDSTLANVASRTKDAGSAVVPTMAIWNNVNGNSSFGTLRSYPELGFMPAETVAEWTATFKKVSQAKFETPDPMPRIQQRILKALHDGGVTIFFGTDSPHIFNVPMDRRKGDPAPTERDRGQCQGQPLASLRGFSHTWASDRGDAAFVKGDNQTVRGHGAVYATLTSAFARSSRPSGYRGFAVLGSRLCTADVSRHRAAPFN